MCFSFLLETRTFYATSYYTLGKFTLLFQNFNIYDVINHFLIYWSLLVSLEISRIIYSDEMNTKKSISAPRREVLWKGEFIYTDCYSVIMLKIVYTECYILTFVLWDWGIFSATIYTIFWRNFFFAIFSCSLHEKWMSLGY